MRLTVDADSNVEEINDEINGVNNNVEEMIITVAALGVRLVTLDSSGIEDMGMVNQTLDPREAEGYTWPVKLKHEGTGQESVKLQLSQVQTQALYATICYYLLRMIGQEVQIFLDRLHFLLWGRVVIQFT